jgi:hypothetical protein
MSIGSAPEVAAAGIPKGHGRAVGVAFASGGAVGVGCSALGKLLLQLDIPGMLKTEPLVAVGFVVIILWGVLACAAMLQRQTWPPAFVTLSVLLFSGLLVGGGGMLTTPIYVRAEGSNDLQGAGSKIKINGRYVGWASEGEANQANKSDELQTHWQDTLLLDLSDVQSYIELQKRCLNVKYAVTAIECAKFPGAAKPRSQ